MVEWLKEWKKIDFKNWCFSQGPSETAKNSRYPQDIKTCESDLTYVEKPQKKDGSTFRPLRGLRSIGFGIKDAASASSVMGVADGIVAGSVFVDLIGEGDDIIDKVSLKTKELFEVLN